MAVTRQAFIIALNGQIDAGAYIDEDTALVTEVFLRNDSDRPVHVEINWTNRPQIIATLPPASGETTQAIPPGQGRKLAVWDVENEGWQLAFHWGSFVIKADAVFLTVDQR